MKNIPVSFLAMASAFLAVTTVRATIVDTAISNTSQIRSATNNPYFGAGNTANLVGLNLMFTHPIPGGSSLNGVLFDNINMGTPPTGTVNVTANQSGVTLTVGTPGARDNSARSLSYSGAGGANATVLNNLLQDITYLASGGGNLLDIFSLSGLGASRNVYVQLIGGDSGWNGTVNVVANGNNIGEWTSTAASSSALYGFNVTTDSSGSLGLNLSVATGNFAGIGGIIVLGEVTPVPEPATWVLLCLGGISLLTIRRKLAC